MSDSSVDTIDTIDTTDEILLSHMDRMDLIEGTEIIDYQFSDDQSSDNQSSDISYDSDYDSEELNMTDSEIDDDNTAVFWMLAISYLVVLAGTGTLAISFSCGEILYKTTTGECVVKTIATVMFGLQILLSMIYLIYRVVRQCTTERRMERRLAEHLSERVMVILEENDIELSSGEGIEIVIEDGYI